MSLRDKIRSLTPDFLLGIYRSNKKKKVNKELQKQASEGNVLSESDIVNDLVKLGIEEGDSVLVHSSMSKIGYLKEGPMTVINAIKNVVTDKGNILMPTSPNGKLQLDYIRSTKVFDINSSPSSLGAISETFRKLPDVRRSASPTEPVSAYGPLADWFTNGHLGSITPYDSNSPFARLAEKKGKILYIGVTLDNAGTSLHTLEDAVDQFKFPVYYPEIFEITVVDTYGKEHLVKTKVHNPEFSLKRKCDELIPLFKQRGVIIFGKIGNAPTMCFDAHKMLEVMLDEYKKNNVTMYTPNGEELKY